MPSAAAINLPGDLVEEILIRLPVKSLVRFYSTCKSLRSLIKNPNFIANHAHRARIASSRSNDFSFVAISDRFDTRLKLFSVSDSFKCLRQMDLNIASLPNYDDDDKYITLEIIGCCRGLICLVCLGTRSHQYMTCIWNPATRQIKVITADRTYPPYAGFGFDDRINDYTFVRFSKNFCECEGVIQFKVYSLGSGTWKVSDKFSINERFQATLCTTALVNGVFYRKAFESSREQSTLISYDVVTGTLNRDIKLPNSFNGNGKIFESKIWEFYEKLWLIDYKVCMIDDKVCYDYELWVMDENRLGSWTKRFSPNLTGYHDYMSSFFFTRSGEYFLLKKNFNADMVIRKLGSNDAAIGHPFCIPKYYHKMFLYEETLQSVSG